MASASVLRVRLRFQLLLNLLSFLLGAVEARPLILLLASRAYLIGSGVLAWARASGQLVSCRDYGAFEASYAWQAGTLGLSQRARAANST